MAVYVILLVILFAVAFMPKKNGKSSDCIYWGAGALLILLEGFRYGSGTDYWTYVTYYENLVETGEVFHWQDFELGYCALNEIFAFFNMPTEIFLLTISAVTTLLIMYTCDRYSPDREFSLFLYAALFFYFESYNAMRQYIAVAIVFFAYGFIDKRKPISYIISILIASLFHTTALLMLPVYLLLYLEIDRRICWIWLGVCAFGGMFGKPIIQFMVSLIPKYGHYADYGASSAWINLLVLVATYTLLHIVQKQGEHGWTIKASQKLMILALGITLLVTCNVLFARIAVYFYIFVILALPLAVKLYTGMLSRYSKLAVCGVAALVYIYYLLHNNQGIVPYALSWFH